MTAKATITVCCDGCGRDMRVAEDNAAKEHYCFRCTGRGTQQPSEQRGRSDIRPGEWFGGQCNEDQYDEGSEP